MFDFGKGKTMKLFGSVHSKVAITTNMWAVQNQKRGFIAITAHCIDSLWKLQNQILRYDNFVFTLSSFITSHRYFSSMWIKYLVIVLFSLTFNF